MCLYLLIKFLHITWVKHDYVVHFWYYEKSTFYINYNPYNYNNYQNIKYIIIPYVFGQKYW
jgi:hypothetical protein